MGEGVTYLWLDTGCPPDEVHSPPPSIWMMLQVLRALSLGWGGGEKKKEPTVILVCCRPGCPLATTRHFTSIHLRNASYLGAGFPIHGVLPSSPDFGFRQSHGCPRGRRGRLAILLL